MAETNLKRTTIMAEEEMLYKIEQIARREGKSKAAIIREALVAYVAVAEAEQPPDDPLLRLIGLAGETAVPTDMANGQDESDILENIDPRYGFALRDEKDPA
ncbi:ribbon-helix-helix domain-containing protein [Candidatus Leptofilum sp.]|uniref:ribbon-helix-helix domain-containing protein n=1 Tax=Candidatus Leptofilum sp. TaxID=3241576 RepID=UPI003B5B51D0